MNNASSNEVGPLTSHSTTGGQSYTLSPIRPGDMYEYEITIVTPNHTAHGTTMMRVEIPEAVNRCNKNCRMLTKVTKVGETDTAGIMYFTQDSDGSLFGHGTFSPMSGTRFVIWPDDGMQLLIRSPICIGDEYRSVAQMEDGELHIWSCRVEMEEEVTVPAGTFTTLRLSAFADESSAINLNYTLWVSTDPACLVKIVSDNSETVITSLLTSMNRMVRLLPLPEDQ